MLLNKTNQLATPLHACKISNRNEKTIFFYEKNTFSYETYKKFGLVDSELVVESISLQLSNWTQFLFLRSIQILFSTDSHLKIPQSLFQPTENFIKQQNDNWLLP